MDNFKEELEKRTKQTEEIVYSYMPKEENYQKTIMEAMNYSLTAGGKRLRPLLLWETAKMFGYHGEDVYPFMAAIEMIHTYSLVHDDLPEMDNDDYRRGKLTTHKKYGQGMGVLAGDALLNYAYELCADAIVKAEHLENAAKAFQILAVKAGIYGMVGGQTVDVEYTEHEEYQMDADVLNFIYELKTGALIEASMMCGAILAGAKEEEIQTVGEVALLTGLAFQIQDDVLDVTSSAEVLGKPVLSDEKNHKTTYVTLYGLEKAKEKVEEYSNKAIEALDKLGYQNEFLRELLISLISREK